MMLFESCSHDKDQIMSINTQYSSPFRLGVYLIRIRIPDTYTSFSNRARASAHQST